MALIDYSDGSEAQRFIQYHAQTEGVSEEQALKDYLEFIDFLAGMWICQKEIIECNGKEMCIERSRKRLFEVYEV